MVTDLRFVNCTNLCCHAGLGYFFGSDRVYAAPGFPEEDGPHYTSTGLHILPCRLQQQSHCGVCRILPAGFGAFWHRNAAAAVAEPHALHPDARHTATDAVLYNLHAVLMEEKP
jgi:hypothetical protein